MVSHWQGACLGALPQTPHPNPVLAALYFVANLGHQWVIVFFVLSGYLVGGSVLRSFQAERWSWRKYLLIRLTRLYVVLLPALILGGAIDWAGMHLPGAGHIYTEPSGEHALLRKGQPTLTLPVLAENVLFLQNTTLPGWGGAPMVTFGSNGALWSLSNEFWYYIAFPLLVIALTGTKSPLKRACCGLAALVLGWLVGHLMVVLFLPWLMGVAIHAIPQSPFSQDWLRRLALASALAFMGLSLVIGGLTQSFWSDLLLGAAVSLLIWMIVRCAQAPLPSGYVWLAKRLAQSSYTLYLVHVPVLVFLKTYFNLPNGQYGREKFWICAGLLIFVVAYSHAVYWLFERNTDRIRSRIAPLVLPANAA
jgi:peptidoglycan/LPS O-acetylase OafA/YrhL